MKTLSTVLQHIECVHQCSSIYKTIIIVNNHQRAVQLSKFLRMNDYTVDDPVLNPDEFQEHHTVQRFLQHETRLILVSIEVFEALSAHTKDSAYMIVIA